MKNVHLFLIFFVPYVFCNFEADKTINISKQGNEIEITRFAAKASKTFLYLLLA